MNGTQAQEGQQSAERSLPSEAVIRNFRRTEFDSPNVQWLADQHRKQEERRCYVCGGRDDGGCHGIDGERAECPWH